MVPAVRKRWGEVEKESIQVVASPACEPEQRKSTKILYI
jgi:hypothetical protein